MQQDQMMAKAREAKTAEELLDFAKEMDITLTEEQAKQYFANFHTTGELSDDELDAVAGGGCSTSVNGTNKTVVTSGCRCFTGQFESAVTMYDSQYNDYRMRPDAEPRVGGWIVMGDDGCCGWCMHLGMKNGLGYCKLS